MKDNQELNKERIIIGLHAIDIHRHNAAPNRQSIILVHGIGISSRYFIPFARLLAEDYNIIAIDLPGYGKTPKPARTLSIVELADIVIQLTHHLQLSQSILIGQSMGCQVVARAAQKAPDLFAKMILLGPTVNVRERSLWMQALRLFQDTFYEPLEANKIILADYARMGLRRYLKTTQYMLQDHIEKSLAECNIPTLIVRGEKDKIVPDDWINFLHDLTPRSQVARIIDGPHVVQYKTAAPLTEVCRRFINGN